MQSSESECYGKRSWPHDRWGSLWTGMLCWSDLILLSDINQGFVRRGHFQQVISEIDHPFVGPSWLQECRLPLRQCRELFTCCPSILTSKPDFAAKYVKLRRMDNWHMTNLFLCHTWMQCAAKLSDCVYSTLIHVVIQQMTQFNPDILL